MTQLTRRGLLMAGLAAMAAPAVVRAASLMPIYVPRREILTPDMLRAEIAGLNMRPGDFTIESWLMPRDTGGKFVYSAIACKGDQILAYKDGVPCDAASAEITALRRVASAAVAGRRHGGPRLDAVYVGDLTISAVARVPVARHPVLGDFQS